MDGRSRADEAGVREVPIPKCPRCLHPVDDEGNCADPRCGYPARMVSLRAFRVIFGLCAFAHGMRLLRFGVPAVDSPDVLAYWFFVGLCVLFVNCLATAVIYVPYVFAFELEPEEYPAWLRWAKRIGRPIV